MWSSLGTLVAHSRRRSLLVVALWVLLAGIVPMLSPTVDEVKEEGGTNAPVPGSQSAEARDLLLRSFPDQQGVPAIIVVHDPQARDEVIEAEVARMAKRIEPCSLLHRPRLQAQEFLGRVINPQHGEIVNHVDGENRRLARPSRSVDDLDPIALRKMN